MELGERQKAWIAALRSGKYEQGKLNLRSKEDRFCCLGVACDLVPGLEWDDGDAVYMGYDDSEVMPQGIVEYYGFYSHSGHFREDKRGGVAACLTQWNDILGLSFNEIANRIEADPSVFFKESK